MNIAELKAHIAQQKLLQKATVTLSVEDAEALVALAEVNAPKPDYNYAGTIGMVTQPDEMLNSPWHPERWRVWP